jgi:hypothetical protein
MPTMSPPPPARCLERPYSSSQKGGTLIAEGVIDFESHKRHIADPDGYRPCFLAPSPVMPPVMFFWLRPRLARRFARFRARQLGSVPVFAVPVMPPRYVFWLRPRLAAVCQSGSAPVVPVGLRPRLARPRLARRFARFRARQLGSVPVFAVPVMPPRYVFWLRPRLAAVCQSGSVPVLPRLVFASRALSPFSRPIASVGLRPRFAASLEGSVPVSGL